MHIDNGVTVEHGIGSCPYITGEQDHIRLEGLHFFQYFAVKLRPDLAVFQRLVALCIVLPDIDCHAGDSVCLRSGNRFGVGFIRKNSDDLKRTALSGFFHFFLQFIRFPKSVAGAGTVAEHP